MILPTNWDNPPSNSIGVDSLLEPPLSAVDLILLEFVGALMLVSPRHLRLPSQQWRKEKAPAAENMAFKKPHVISLVVHDLEMLEKNMG